MLATAAAFSHHNVYLSKASIPFGEADFDAVAQQVVLREQVLFLHQRKELRSISLSERHGSRSLRLEANVFGSEPNGVLGDEIGRRCVAEGEADSLLAELFFGDGSLLGFVEKAFQLGTYREC